jgi:hypothetical protein
MATLKQTNKRVLGQQYIPRINSQTKITNQISEREKEKIRNR